VLFRGRVDALDLGVAVESVHAASLVFDDLPSMDDGTLRRGQPTLHLRFGESTAILAAVALINRAFQVWGERGPSRANPSAPGRRARARVGEASLPGAIATRLDPAGATLDELERIHAEDRRALWRRPQRRVAARAWRKSRR
jgi:geranylgeranyl diphosphate synthase type II